MAFSMVRGHLDIQTDVCTEILKPKKVSDLTHSNMPCAVQIEYEQKEFVYPALFYKEKLHPEVTK